MIRAMSSWRTPTPAKYRTFSRIALSTTKGFLAMVASPAILAVGAFVKRLPRVLMNGVAPGEALPAPYEDIDISRVEFETVADPAAHFGGDQARAGAEKRIIDRLTGPASVGDRPAH